MIMDEMPPCPEQFRSTGSFCYKVIPSSSYPPDCDFPQLLSFEEYIDEIDKTAFPIWMPIERDRSYGYGERIFYSQNKDIVRT